jgi:peptidyl-dipeptidase Dcp
MQKFSLLIIVSLFFACVLPLISQNSADNPFFKKYDTKFNVPPFEKIKPEHFLPAIKEGIKQHEKEIDAIANSKAEPTFENTIVAMEQSGELLSEVSTVFFNLNSANTNDELQQIAKEISPLLSNHADNIALNKNLFEKVKAVYDKRKKLKLTKEQEMLLNDTYKGFIRGGAALDEKKQERLRKINEELSLASLKFGENLLAETNDFQMFITDKKDLDGIPQSIIDGAAEAAKEAGKQGQWLFTLHNPSVMPFLQYASNRQLREKIWRAYSMRGNNDNEHDNKQIIVQLTNLRLEKAKLLGYKDFAEYSLEETMAKTPAKVMELLNKLWKPALNVAKKEAKELQKMIDKEGGKFKLEPWDWRYYAEKLRKEKYDLDEESIRPYFKAENVRDGMFALVGKLYGVKFVLKNDIPKYHPDVQTYEVLDKDGSHLAVLFLDFYTRPSKRGGAWMTNYREQYMKDGKIVPPIVSLVCNFPNPTKDQPSLLTYDEAETFFHEFGHGLHGMLSHCTYKSIAGTNVPRDFVEMPSQIMENFLGEPEVLALFAKHYKTGEIIPKALVDKIHKSSLFNQGFATTEYLAASLLDMAYHTVTKPIAEGSVLSFEKKELDKIGLIPEIISRYRSTYFNHIFGGGYSAGYYSYIWSAVLDSDGFEAFKKNGIFDQKTAESFRKNVLERGKTDDPMTLYKNFRGAEPSIEPLLKKRGLK